MNAIVLMVVGFAAFVLGYFFYSRFLGEKIFKLDPDFVTPAHELEDGVDFVPTRPIVLWGHHFAAVAGAAPIVGPAIAVIWGWLPAFLWVTVGTVFFAGVHDYGALWASVRNKGESVGSMTARIVGTRARNIFMIVIFLLLLMVNSVFAIIIAGEHIAVPSSVIPTWVVIVVAMAIGYLIYKKGMSLLWVTIIGVTVLYGAIWVGSVYPLSLPETVFGLGASAQWVIILFTYAGIASVLPVWLLLQPRDYINGIQLFIGLAILYTAVVIANPTIVAPAINMNVPDGTPPLIPLLFVTIACGAISGFHGLVASGTTSKQLDKEPHSRQVGYLGSVGEGTLAIAAIIACTAGFASLEEWEGRYTSFTAGGLDVFVQGGARILETGMSLSPDVGETLLAVMAILFAATTMDAGVRLQRYIIQEVGNNNNMPFLTGRTVSTLVAVGACLTLAFVAGGAEGSGGMIIWPLFGTSNQLLAGLTLMVISVFLIKLGRPAWVTIIPLTFLMVMALIALAIQLGDFWEQQNYLLVVLDIVVLGASILVTLEAWRALREAKSEAAGGV